MQAPILNDEGIGALQQVVDYVRDQFARGHITGDHEALAQKIFEDGERQRWQGPARTWRTFADGYIRVHKAKTRQPVKGGMVRQVKAHVTVCGLCWHAVDISECLILPGDVVIECNCIAAAVARYTAGMTDEERQAEDARAANMLELLRRCQLFYQLPVAPGCGGAAITAAITAQRHLIEGAHHAEYVERTQPWFESLSRVIS